VQVKTATEAEEKINNSYQGLYRQMVDIFRGLGVEAVLTEGQPFDPALHDAIMREETDDVADGTVLQEFRKGFQLSGKLLRPAMVKVAVSSGSSGSSTAEEGGAAGDGAEANA
jgi:molecular chaperone GrpE